MAIPIFYSYSHKDETFRETLETHLAILKRQGYLEGWHDRRIAPGNNWEEEINLNLQNAEIILLLVSSNFLASDYCYDTLEQHKKNECIVIPIILKPCLWNKSHFNHLQALPKDGKPITTWDNEDEAWLNVAEGILEVIEKQKPSILEDKPHSYSGKQMNDESEMSENKELILDEADKPGGDLYTELESLVSRFLSAYNKWYFSPLRIQKWGSKQPGFSGLSQFDTFSIKAELESLHARGKVKTARSQKGNTIYKLA